MSDAERIPVLLDTDIGSDIDDAVCLAYLLAQPRCELLGVTTVSTRPSSSGFWRMAGRSSLKGATTWTPSARRPSSQ